MLFFEQFDNGGSGDYTKEKYKQEDEQMTKEDMLKKFMWCDLKNQ